MSIGEGQKCCGRIEAWADAPLRFRIPSEGADVGTHLQRELLSKECEGKQKKQKGQKRQKGLEFLPFLPFLPFLLPPRLTL
jgi:hypothetical protein